MTSREEVLRGLEAVGAKQCVYSHGKEWATYCDCKYGIDPAGDGQFCGEKNGCPELRSAHRVIEALTDEQFIELNMGQSLTPTVADA